MIKAVFFDIDGTLVSFKTHKLPDSAARALDRLREKGIKVFIATGRQARSINNLGTQVFDGYVTLNGGYCLAGKERVIYKHPIPPEDIAALIRYQEEVEEFPCALVEEDGIYQNYVDDSARQLYGMLDFPHPPARPLRGNGGKEVYQLIAFFSPAQEERILSVLPHCEATRWNPLFADVVPRGSSKAVGIDKIIAYYGISLRETMAFGDGGNDSAMLRHAGIGVAMGNAGDAVKAAADYVTDSVDDDGVWNALRHFGLIAE
ncbi:Cof-type HAD-IIB family hydrolase [Parabacteroides sp. ZJ-118]|uniref:Cof-type HAD-IIB family hydrolase n=1 Tax=Parabacteroides sp. ZJ-118 TaxID=2709398 RepID=UPI0013EA1AC0|nr:Cof-type HAD-IIB family hydrolase [Parabacteroides sp. ZJ-118]